MKIVDNYAWSTHKPLLASLVNVADPGLIVELGMGIHSTPIFLNSKCNDIIFVETDDEWLEYVKKNNSFDDRHEVIFHDLGPGKGRKIIPPHSLSLEKKMKIIEYYKDISTKFSSRPGTPKMLFVDNVDCCRTLAINTLYKYFDIIVYHDCEPLGITWYGYRFEKDLVKEFYHYILKTPKSWAGCFISHKLNIELELKNDIKSHIIEYSKEIGVDPNKIYLERGH